MTNPRIRDFAPVGNPNAGRHKVAAAMHKLKQQVKDNYDLAVGYDYVYKQWEAWVRQPRGFVLASCNGNSPMQAADRLIELFPEFFNSQP